MYKLFQNHTPFVTLQQLLGFLSQQHLLVVPSQQLVLGVLS
jgi:hypothetical protein